MSPRRDADDDNRVFALEVVCRTREAWLPRTAKPHRLNPNVAPEPKTLGSVAAPACRTVAGRRPWASIAVAFAVVAAVLGAELWAVHAGSSLDSAAAHRIVGDVSVTLSRVAEASLIGPVD